MRYELKAGGVGWHVWNHTLFQEIAAAKAQAQGGIVEMQDLFPTCEDKTYSYPDPVNPGLPQPFCPEGLPASPFGGHSVYDFWANKYVERQAEQRVQPIDEQLHLDDLQLDNLEPEQLAQHKVYVCCLCAR